MTSNSIMECERKELEKIRKFQLPHYFKKIGVSLAIFSFIFMFVNKFAFDSAILKFLTKYGLLAGMLIISISKEAIEDELIINLRAQSFTFAFIVGVGYALVLPFINYGVDAILDPANAVLEDNGDFIILWILLAMQVFYFELLKKIS